MWRDPSLLVYAKSAVDDLRSLQLRGNLSRRNQPTRRPTVEREKESRKVLSSRNIHKNAVMQSAET